MKAKMNSCILNQLQLVFCSYLNNVVVNCFPISFFDGFNFSVLKTVEEDTDNSSHVLIQMKLLNYQFSNYTTFFLNIYYF